MNEQFAGSPMTDVLVQGLYRHVRRLFGDAVFDEGRQRLEGAVAPELERIGGRVTALRDVLDLFDAVMGERVPAAPRSLD
jgi:hypothetical protein